MPECSNMGKWQGSLALCCIRLWTLERWVVTCLNFHMTQLAYYVLDITVNCVDINNGIKTLCLLSTSSRLLALFIQRWTWACVETNTINYNISYILHWYSQTAMFCGVGICKANRKGVASNKWPMYKQALICTFIKLKR